MNIVSTVPDVYLNTIPANAVHTKQAVTNSSAASAPINYQAIGMTKAFSPASIQAGGNSELSITLQNPSASAYTGVTFTDTLPAGVTVASEPLLTQCGGTISYSANSITLTGGIVPAASGTPGVCTVRVQVTSSISGSFTNTIYARTLSTDQGATNIIDVTANLNVYGTGTGMTGSKAFSPSTIAVGGISRMTINLSAPADTDLNNFSVTDALPAGVQVAASPNPTKNANCSGGAFSPTAGSTTVTYSGGRIPKGTQCTLAVNVTSNSKGIYNNIISPLNISNSENRNISGNISRTLTVSGISVGKSFYPTSVGVNGVSTLSVVLTNVNTSYLYDVAFSDTLPAGVVIADDPQISTTCGNVDIVTASIGAGSFSIAGGLIPAQVGTVPGICTVNVNVKGLTSGTKTNRILANAVSGKIFGSGVTITNPAQVSADLIVTTLTINVNKTLSPSEVFGGAASTMTIRLTNPNNAALAGIAFTDTLPESTDPLNPGFMSIAIPAQVSTGSCGGTIVIAGDRRSFSYSGGSLPAVTNSFCELNINVTSNVSGNLTNTIQAGAVTTSNGASNTQSASATITNLPWRQFNQVFHH